MASPFLFLRRRGVAGGMVSYLYIQKNGVIVLISSPLDAGSYKDFKYE